MPGVGDRPQRLLDLVPAPLIVETAPYQSGNERTATPGSGPSIKILDKIIVQLNVQSHVCNNTHKSQIHECVEATGRQTLAVVTASPRRRSAKLRVRSRVLCLLSRFDV